MPVFPMGLCIVSTIINSFLSLIKSVSLNSVGGQIPLMLFTWGLTWEMKVNH